MRARQASSQQAAFNQQLAQYSRTGNPNYKSRKRKTPPWKKALVVAGALILCAVFAVGAYALWFSGALNERLSMGDQTDAAVNDALTSPIAGEPFYMLLLGSDSREGSGTSGNAAESGDNQRSDVMILVRVDAKNKQVTMVSIPRDTPLSLEDGTIVKINEAYNIGGAAYSIKAVSELTGVPIAHYAEVHFSEFQELVDKLGGVEVDVPVELSYKDALTGEWITLEPGVQTIDGQQAQIFARARHEYETDQDAHRQNNIRTLLEAIITKVLEKPFYELPDTVLSLAESVGTDLNASDLVSLAMEYAGGSGSMTMYSGTGPTDGDINEAAGGIWLCYENPEGWANLMAVVESGDDPSGLDVNSTAIIPSAA
ncbi:LCP family protein [Raoultibacter phocaeensis]|uniref:LCP family protein n=1 Tax=Raoultibacter phocaeensis TaxID=2479841 RepID=UPI0021045761|nr:LCP family protein [Raoultibacter phocaeensis]